MFLSFRPPSGIKIRDFVNIGIIYLKGMNPKKTEEPSFVKGWRDFNACVNTAFKTLQNSNDHGTDTQVVPIAGTS
jgi:hypothetical protein